MASHVYVVDSSARRYQIKTTSATYLRDVLEEACRKLNKDPNQYSLQDSSRPPKTIDLSAQIRLSGLVSGAKLQLVQQSRSPSVISVALQLPEVLGGGRLQDKLASDTSLWQVLRKFEEGAAGGSSKLNITQRGRPSTTSGSGTLEYEQPVVHVVGRDLKTFADLQKSLMQLGFNNGNVLLRLTFMDSGQPMHIAMEEITKYFSGVSDAKATTDEPQTTTSDSHGAHSGPVGNTASMPAVDEAIARDNTPESSIPADTDMTEAPAPGPQETTTHPAHSASAIPPQMSIYKPSSTSTPQAARETHDPDDYIPTIDHAKSHQATLNRAARNQRLLSDAELAKLEQERQEKLAIVLSTTVRVRMPDQMMIDIVITPDQTPAGLYETVREKLAAPEAGFQLRHTGVKGQVLTLEQNSHKYLIRDLGFTQRVLLTMVWNADTAQEVRKGAVLKESLRAQAVELKIPDASGVQEHSKDVGLPKANPALEKAKATKQDVEAKMKKFLGFGKKK